MNAQDSSPRIGEPGASSPDTTLDFLAGGGETGTLIRAFDWAATELGAPGGWPQSLRTAVRLMLSTQHPTFIFWGSRHRCLYNDGFSASLGPEKHPAMLGAQGREAWAEIWPIIAPQIDLVMRGDGATWHEHALIPIFRHGAKEDIYWSYSYSPIDDAEARLGVGGVFVLCQDTTLQVLADRREKFMIGVADSLLTIDDPQNAMAWAAEAIGRQVGGDCAGYIYYDSDIVHGKVETMWSVPGFSDVSGTHEVAAYGDKLDQLMRAGEAAAFDDVQTAFDDPSVCAAFLSFGVNAFIQVPMLSSGKLIAALFVLSSTARAWSDDEIALVEEVTLRTSAAVERKISEQALRDSEALLRAIGESTGDLLYAKDRQHRIIYANPAIVAAIGRSVEELLGNSEREWHDNEEEAEAIIANDDRVMTSGHTMQADEIFSAPGARPRTYSSTKAPMRDAAGNVVGLVGVSRDVTERIRDHLHLKLLVAELNHRVKNTLSIVQSLAHQTFRGEGELTARRAFEGRLTALATAHDLLTREKWEATDLAAVVRETLAAQIKLDNVTIAGPLLRLEPATAVSIAMALHELTTNAIKYGSLSKAGGQIAVTWTIDSSEPPCLAIEWRETGGPVVVAPDKRGFGSRMIERALATELKGKAVLHFHADGLVCRINAPVPRTPPASVGSEFGA